MTALMRFIEINPNWRLVAECSDRKSGASLERPAQQEALAAAERREFDVLLVYRVDRLARSISLLLDLYSELERCDVAFRSATEPIDTGTPLGKMRFSLLGIFAEFERQMLCDRITQGDAAKLRRGSG
jgi:site-specific DNA recombinase